MMLYRFINDQWTLIKEDLSSLPNALKFIGGKLIQLELRDLSYQLHVEERGDVNLYKLSI